MFIIAMDFDDTMFKNGGYVDGKPTIGSPNQDVIDKVIEFQETGLAEICLWTCREEGALEEAVKACKKAGIKLSAVNDNSPSEKVYIEKVKKESGQVFGLKKIFADLYVDDKAPGSIEYFLKINVEKTCNNFKDR